MAVAGLASVCGCSLIDLSVLDRPREGTDGSMDEPIDAPASADVSEGGCDAACDATQDGDDSAPASDDSGDASEGSAEASSSDATSDSAMDAGSLDAASDSARVEAGADSGDGHPCGAKMLTVRAAVASSSQLLTPGNALLPNFATDQNFASRWGSALQIDPSWIYMDFGASAFVGEVDVIWQAACGASYDIDISSDTKTWTTLKTVVGNTVGAQNPPDGWAAPEALHYAGLKGRGRYVRFYGTARCLPMYGYSIWEMRALGDTDSNCTP